jgi:hypothetical protein
LEKVADRKAGMKCFGFFIPHSIVGKVLFLHIILGTSKKKLSFNKYCILAVHLLSSSVLQDWHANGSDVEMVSRQSKSLSISEERNAFQKMKTFPKPYYSFVQIFVLK